MEKTPTCSSCRHFEYYTKFDGRFIVENSKCKYKKERTSKNAPFCYAYDPKNSRPLDVQEGGNHYKQFKIQPVEFITANNLGFCEGNIIKYVCRHSHKNGLEDLKKAKHYIDLLITLTYENEGDENGCI